MNILIAAIVVLGLTSQLEAQSRDEFENLGVDVKALVLVGRRAHNVYLGCLNCSPLDAVSLCNPLGRHGNPLKTDSPWNPLAVRAPAVVDTIGNFYGYFTVNKVMPAPAHDDPVPGVLPRSGKRAQP